MALLMIEKHEDHEKERLKISTIPVVREMLLNIFPGMLLVTCHRRDMWRDAAISTPWCDEVVDE